jgi:hypothetical protein
MPIQEGSQFSPDRNITSPGVFTRENDLSGVAQGVANIGGVVVAPFPKGPAFAPTLFTDVNSLQNQFGVPDGVLYGPYTAVEYLTERGLVTVCRVGGLTGYEQKYPFGIWAIKGEYARNDSFGAINSASSFVYFSGDIGNEYSESVSFSSTTYSSSLSLSYGAIPDITGSILTQAETNSSSMDGYVTFTFYGGGSGYYYFYFNQSGSTWITSSAASGSSLTFSTLSSSTYAYKIKDVNSYPVAGVTYIGSVFVPQSASYTSSSIFDFVVNGHSSNSTNSFTINPTTSSALTIHSASFTVTFQNGAADADAPYNPIVGNNSGSILYNNSGSILYHGTTQTFGEAVNLVLSSSVDSSSFSSSIANGTFVAYVNGPTPIHFPYASDPFNNLIFHNATMSANLGVCGFPIINISGVIEGPFGNYTTFSPYGTASFDPCVLPAGAWSSQSNADVRLLAVLADTMYGGIEDLITPGFYGSSLNFTTPIDPVIGVNDIPTGYSLTLKNSNSTTPYGVYQFSLDTGDQHYITNVFGSDPATGDPAKQVPGQKIEAAYLYKVYEDAIAEIVSEKTNWFIVGAALPSSSISGEPMNFTDQYSRNVTEGDSTFAITGAYTPWVVSQKIAPWESGSVTAHRFELFRVLTLADGTDTNTQFKIQIENIKLAGQVAGSDWGTFTLTVRSYSDTDKRPIVIEQFNNLNLDPNSANYIARRIGDRYNYINNLGKILEFGTFANNSQNIRIEMASNNYPVSSLPYGFEAYATPTNGALGYWTPVMKYTKASVYGLQPGKYPSGITFGDAPAGADTELFNLYPTSSTGIGASADNIQYFAPLPAYNSEGTTYQSTGRNVAFSLDDDYELYGVGTGSYLNSSMANVVGNAIPTIYDPVNEPTYIKMRKFVFGFQGGFDGQSPTIPLNVGGDITPGNTQGLDCTTVSSAGSVAYNQCVSALGNSDEFDINLIAVPGIIHETHPYVTNMVVDMCEKRGDCFYIMDLYVDDGNPSSGQIDQVVSYAAEYDTNYAASYYPWIKILDTYNNQIVTVPPSVVLPAVYASNDKVAAEWFAPAGLNRGGIPIATQVTDRTTHEERDTLYEGKVNPIAAFPGSGIVVWGQKTLQNADSALNRINVRRLLINIKKFFASTAKYLVFEQNVASTRNKFLSIVNPYLESVQQRSGLYAFYVKMDDQNNTPDIIDQNILYGQIYLKPTKTAEFIILDFNILASGASFPNA